MPSWLVRFTGKWALGRTRLYCTVRSSIFVTCSSMGTAGKFGLTASEMIGSLRIVVCCAISASALSGVPSWKVMPSRSVTCQLEPSPTGSADSANHGNQLPSWSK